MNKSKCCNAEVRRLYLTKEVSSGHWHYLTDPLNPYGVQEMGIVRVNRADIRVDEFGAYIEIIQDNQE